MQPKTLLALLMIAGTLVLVGGAPAASAASACTEEPSQTIPLVTYKACADTTSGPSADVDVHVG